MPGYFLWKNFLIFALAQPASLPSQGTFWISSKELARAQSLPGKVTLLPLQLGTLYVSGTTLPGPDPHQILITTLENFSALKSCRAPLKIESGEVALIGEDLATIENCGLNRLRFVVDQPSATTRAQFEKAEAKLRRFSGSFLESRWADGRRVLVLHSSIHKNKILDAIGAKLFPFYEISLRNEVSPGKNMIFELTMFEFSREKAQSLGIKWPKSLSVLAVNSEGNSHLSLMNLTKGGAEEILLATDFGETQGIGKILAQPTLRTKPGVESRFLSGGEIPIRNNNAFHSETVWKSYGLKVSLTPSGASRVGDQEVSVDFKLEFSEPNPATGIDDVPGILQRQLDSKFDVRMDELTVLTTMVSSREGKNRDGLLFFSQVPILGFLFGQTSNSKNNSELWFAIKPTWDEISVSKARDRPLTFESSL